MYINLLIYHCVKKMNAGKIMDLIISMGKMGTINTLYKKVRDEKKIRKFHKK